jgi:AcrR family transcriptional regulator
MKNKVAEHPPDRMSPPAHGLRERKKSLMRQQLSDTATRLFMERGFDDVRVTDIAEECGVSEATVFNYFPKKEELVLDRLEATLTSLQIGLNSLDLSPIEAVLHVLEEELRSITDRLIKSRNARAAAAAVLQFGDMIRTTPSLRAYSSDMIDQYVEAAAGVIAVRSGLNPEDPEPQIAARALLGLWHVQTASMRRHLRDNVLSHVHQDVTQDVRRAARQLGIGLYALGVS